MYEQNHGPKGKEKKKKENAKGSVKITSFVIIK